MSIEVQMTFGPQSTLRANVTTEIEKLRGLKFGQSVIVKISDGNTGKWGMARLWRSWMASTAEYMAAQGCVMPLMIGTNGEPYGQRKFNADDAHELFTHKWLGADVNGDRLSWSKSGREGMRPATKGERFNALRQHEEWAIDKGIKLLNPRDSEYSQLKQEQNK